MIKYASHNMPTAAFNAWDDAMIWACAMRNQFGMKYTVRFFSGRWHAYVPKIEFGESS